MKIREIKLREVDNYFSQCPLGEYDIKDLNQFKDQIDTIWYFYLSGSYEGSGESLTKTVDGKFVLNCFSHCSCYGPIESFNLERQFDTLEDAKRSCSEEYQKQLKPIFDAAAKHEKKANKKNIA